MIWELKRYGSYLKKSFFRSGRLNFLILYVTSKCNLSCGSCFYHKKLNQIGDLPLAEYEKISKSLAEFSILGIGGGEPFTRPDLADICALFVERNKVDTIFIPTNGVLAEAILANTENLLKKFPNVSLSVNPSLDGLAEFHNKNRGAPAVFESCLKTIEGLIELKKKYKNLQVIVNTVVMRENFEDVIKLMEFLKQFEIDFQAFELLRGEPRDKKTPELDQVKKIHELILKNRLWHLEKRRAGAEFNLIYRLEKIIVLGVLKYSQEFKEAALRGESWPVNCPAGENIKVIYPNGLSSCCEILPPRAGENKPKKNCACTHICFIHSAIAKSPKSILGVISGYFKARKIIKYD